MESLLISIAGRSPSRSRIAAVACTFCVLAGMALSLAMIEIASADSGDQVTASHGDATEGGPIDILAATIKQEQDSTEFGIATVANIDAESLRTSAGGSLCWSLLPRKNRTHQFCLSREPGKRQFANGRGRPLSAKTDVSRNALTVSVPTAASSADGSGVHSRSAARRTGRTR